MSKSSSTKTDWKTSSENIDINQLVNREIEFEPFDFIETKIVGVPIYTKHLPFASCIHMRIGFKYGAIHDKPGIEGVAHFLEHMLFDGSSMFADKKETQEFGKVIMLDTLNAYTSLFELFVTGKCLPHNFDLSLEAIFSMIISPTLTKEDYEHEKKVITQEAWGRYLNDTRIAYIKKTNNNLYSDIPDRLRLSSPLGWPDTIEKITHQDILDAHKKYFVRENLQIFLAGNLEAIGDIKALEDKLQNFINQMPEGEKASQPFIPKTISAPKILKFDHTYTETGITERQQATISLDATLPRTDIDEDGKNSLEDQKINTTAYLASYLLSDLVYRKLRLENSWCYGASASDDLFVDNLSLSMGSVLNFNHIDEAIEIMWKIVEDIVNGEYSQDFDKTKRLAIENILARERTTDKILDVISQNLRTNGNILTLKQRIHNYIDVGFEDIQKLLKVNFTKEKVFVEIIRPTKEN